MQFCLQPLYSKAKKDWFHSITGTKQSSTLHVSLLIRVTDSCTFGGLRRVIFIKNEKQCFIGISKHREDSLKYHAQRSIFDEIRGVRIADETLSRVFDISS